MTFSLFEFDASCSGHVTGVSTFETHSIKTLCNYYIGHSNKRAEYSLK